MNKWLHLLLLFLLSTAPAVAAGERIVTVARFAKAPRIDGKVSPGEWDRAAGSAGFQMLSPKNGFLEARIGRSLVGFTDDRLYIAVISEMPPDGKLYASRTNRDSDVVFDEGIELWLDPNRERRAAKQGDQSFYQFIGNAIGTVYDVRFDPKKGTPDIGWNGNWEYKNSVDHKTHTWTAELSIPFVDLGWQKGRVVGRQIGVLIARNFKNPWSQSTWFPHRGAFVSWSEYPCLVLTKDKPTVQISSIGARVHAGNLQLKVQILNPGQTRQAKLTFKSTSSDMPGLSDEKVLRLPRRGTARYKYTIPPGRYHEDASHFFELTVNDHKTGESYFNYLVRWTKAPAKRWHVRVGPNPEAAVKLAYYPSYNLLKLLVDTRELEKEAEKIKQATISVAANDGKQVVKKDISWKKPPTEQTVKIPELPDGEYTATITLDGYRKTFRRQFRRIRFPWEGNRLGISNAVYPPFKPIKVRGKELSVVLRRCRSGGLGLWDSVNSLGRELLAAPIILKANGQTLSGAGRFVEIKPHKAVYEGAAAGPALRVKTRCTTEYDGCMKVELTLVPPPPVAGRQMPLTDLCLEIPLKDKLAPLWHASTTSLRLNPAGNTPAGDGVVWDSRKFPDGTWFGNFKCYIWLGAEERGLCWFADNDKGWELGTNDAGQAVAPCQELIRKDGVLTLRINFVQKPITLKKPRKIVFGLMASPAKPMPKNWRRVLFAQRHPGYETIGWMGSTYWGTAETMHETYPLNHDMSILSKMQECRLTGDRSRIEYFIREWSARNLQGKVPGSKSKKQIQSLVRWSLGDSTGRYDYYNVYWEEFHSVSANHIETKVFGNEWSGGYWIGGMHSLAPSYLDFQCWYGAEFIRRGIGLYFDNTCPKRAYDPLTTEAYRLPNGQLQPSANMWRHREYLRRIWTLHQQLGPPATKPIMMLHMTNTHILPYMVWNESNLDLEWFYGPEPQQSKYPHDLLRAESIGRQTGNIPLVLAAIDKTKSEQQKRIAHRTRFGTMFVHEIKSRLWDRNEHELWKKVFNFGYGLDDCRVYNYWDEDYPVKASNDQVKSVLLKRGRELMLVLCTWNSKPETVVLTLDTKALKLKPATAINAETEEPFRLNASRITVPLPSYGVRILRIK